MKSREKTEQIQLDRTYHDHLIQLPASELTKSWCILLLALSKCFFNTDMPEILPYNNYFNV